MNLRGTLKKLLLVLLGIRSLGCKLSRCSKSWENWEIGFKKVPLKQVLVHSWNWQCSLSWQSSYVLQPLGLHWTGGGRNIDSHLLLFLHLKPYWCYRVHAKRYVALPQIDYLFSWHNETRRLWGEQRNESLKHDCRWLKMGLLIYITQKPTQHVSLRGEAAVKAIWLLHPRKGQDRTSI